MASAKNVISYSIFFFFFLFWKFLSYLVCVPGFKSINSSSLSKKGMLRVISTPPTPPSPITRSKYLDGIRFHWICWATWYIKLQAMFKHCILKTILQVFLLLIFVWNEIFGSKNWFVFYICLAWFRVAFGVTVLKRICSGTLSIRSEGIRVSLATPYIICWG